MDARHSEIDAHAEHVKAEIRAMAQAALDSISVRVGWFIRSDAQKRRWANAQKVIAQNEKS